MLRPSLFLLAALLHAPLAWARPQLGPAPPGGAIAAYDPATGDIVVSVNDVLSWYVESLSSQLTGESPPPVNIGGALGTDNDARIGVTSFGSALTYSNQYLGRVAAPHLPPGDLHLWSSAGFGMPQIEGPVHYVPEPTAAALVVAAIVAAQSTRRRTFWRC